MCWCASVAALSHPSAEAEAGARLASRACGRCVPLLTASGSGLVVVVVMMLPHDPVVAPASVVSQRGGVSRVRGGSACGPSTLWRSEVVVLEVRRHSHLVVPWSRQFLVFGVPAALAGDGLLICTGPCSRGLPPLLPSARGSSSWELGVGRVAEADVAPCVVSNSNISH
ncbi:hypothetical protein Taro_044223 [Colocasia esculenta]|uniref:Uncharacterized protein n=1 Tax=Colocasia esculenta TaxID=4460 RepID=A0A843WN62_COLES|nr:hypothetical protein [Colocasia esculenta]